MSLSVARPILTEPGGASAGRPGRRILSMLVARLLAGARCCGRTHHRGRIHCRCRDGLLDRHRPRRLGWPGAAGAARVAGRLVARCLRAPRRRLAGPDRAGPGWDRDRDRCCRWRRTRRTLMAADLERQQRPVGVADVELLAVGDVGGGHAATVEEHPVEAAVVDGDPPALVEPQHQMGTGDQGVGDADVGAQIPADDDVVAGREGAWGSVVPNGQRRGCWSAHRNQLYRYCLRRAGATLRCR